VSLFCRRVEAKAPIGVIFFFHALGDHTAAPGVPEVWKLFSDSGFTVMGCDMTGHGRSIRKESELGLIRDWKVLGDDAVGFIEAVYGDRHPFSPKTKLPFFLSGISTGGMLALHVGADLQRLKSTDASNPVWSFFQGSALAAPLIHQLVQPSAFQTAALKGLRNIGLGKADLAPAPDKKKFPPGGWARVQADPLCYYEKMRLDTGVTLLAMIDVTLTLLPEIAYPISLHHAKEDGVVPVSGSELLIKECKTADADKQLVYYPAGISTHYLFLDEGAPQVVTDMITWMTSRLAKLPMKKKD